MKVNELYKQLRFFYFERRLAMKNLLLGLLLTGALVLPLSGVANAINITNGSFETGDMTGWSTDQDQTTPSAVTAFSS